MNTIDLYLDHLRVERRLSDEKVLDATCLLHELRSFAWSGEVYNCRYVGKVAGQIEALDLAAIDFFLGAYNHSEFRKIARRTFRDYYRFLVLDRRIDTSPMEPLTTGAHHEST